MGCGSSTPDGAAAATVPTDSPDRRGFRAGLVRGSRKNIWDVYAPGRVLGRGMTGHVTLITHRETGQQFAMKCMDLNKLDETLLEDLRNEIGLLQVVRARPLRPSGLCRDEASTVRGRPKGGGRRCGGRKERSERGRKVARARGRCPLSSPARRPLARAGGALWEAKRVAARPCNRLSGISLGARRSWTTRT